MRNFSERDQGRILETPEELTSAMRIDSGVGALAPLTRWLARRDQVADQVASDELALDTLAADFRTEIARETSSPSTQGLAVAAVVLTDTADGVRAGDTLGGDPIPSMGTPLPVILAARANRPSGGSNVGERSGSRASSVRW